MNNLYSKTIPDIIYQITDIIDKRKKQNIYKLNILFVKKNYNIKHIHDIKYDLNYEINNIVGFQKIALHFRTLGYTIKEINIPNVFEPSSYGAYLLKIKFKPNLCCIL
jgi:hypothetical protein